MVDLFATLISAAALGAPPPTLSRLKVKIRKKAPHSVALWAGLTSSSNTSNDGRRDRGHGGTGGRGGGGGSSRGGMPSAEREVFHRRQLVLQVSASSGAVMRGRWKLVLAARKCFGNPRLHQETTTMPGFPSDST